jgi:Fic family protein
MAAKKASRTENAVTLSGNSQIAHAPRNRRASGHQPVTYHHGKFPPVAIEWTELIPLLGPAAAAVARYDGLLEAIPNSEVLLSPLRTQEAVLSSRIEGTQATMGEVLEFEAGEEVASPERRADIQEVLNYRAALREAEKQLRKLPFCERVVREAHRVLMKGVRGQNKSPGAYRKIQNWIGVENTPIDQARFVPVSVDRLGECMTRWERYAHDEALDRLVQIAVLHAEFEALHPFADGNGRLGRMLMPLLLWQWKLIRQPVFYISAWLEARRQEYYDRLLAVSRDDDWTGWCRFFLEALRAQAEDNLGRAQAIMKLHNQLKHRLPELTRSQHAVRALDWIFAKPIFRAPDFVAQAGIPAATARRFLPLLKEGKVLKEIRPGSGKRGAVFAFPELLAIAEGETDA